MARHLLVRIPRPGLQGLLIVLVASVVAPAAAASAACKPHVERVERGTWESRPVEGIHAPDSARLAVDERDPRFVVVADLSGVLVTHDAGCTWKRAAEYSDVLSPFQGIAVDATVAGTGRGRSVHVLVAPWGPFTGYLQPVLLSSRNDGETWTTADVPPASGPAFFTSYALASTVSSDALYLLVHPGATGGVYAKGEGGWRWLSAGAPAQPGTCAPGGPCASRVLRTLHADARRQGALWGLTGGGAAGGEAVARSEDEGASWDYRGVPGLVGGADADDVTDAGTILLLGDFGDYAVSRDGGRSWSVGDYPELASSSDRSTGVSGVTHFDRGRAFAMKPGLTDTSPWAGNVFVFDGRKWANVAPAAFEGYDRTGEEGRRLTFVELAASRGPLVALSSAGDLMTYRR